MKRTIVASILGIAGSLAMAGASHAQGTLNFQNYNSGGTSTAVNAPVTFASAGTVSGHGSVLAGWGVGGEFTADLLYSTDGGVNYTLLTSGNAGVSAGAFGYPAPFTLGGTIADGPVDSVNHTGAGYFYGATVNIPNYSSGAINFIVEAFNGSSYANSLGAGLWRGQSAAWTINPIASGSQPPGFMIGMPAFTVSTPEPTTMAFAGMGLLSLLAFARRKKV